MGTQAPADAISRLPCPHCAEPIALEARLCHHCQSSVLVDVELPAVVTDPRQRYQLARSILALPGAPPLTEIQAALNSAAPAAVRGVTRAFAHEVLNLLSRQGLRGSIASRAAFDTPPRRSRFWPAMGGIGVVLLLLVGVTAWRQALSELKPKDPPAGGSSPLAPVKAPVAAAPLSAREIAQKSLPSTVSLRCRESIGSGFFIGEELVLTNAHVLCPASEPIQVILSDGRKLFGSAERSDSHVDLGLVRVRGSKVAPLPLGDVADLAPGDKLTIIGSPVGLEFTVHEGSVSSLQRSVRGVAYVQLDAKINPGNSGGPVIDAQGRVVAVVTLKHLGAEGIGLALPINYAYSQGLRFVTPPNPQAALSAAFTKMTTRAKEESTASGDGPDTGRSPDGGLSIDRPLLVSAGVDQYRRLVIGVVRIGSAAPRYEEVALKVWHQGENFCTIKGDISTWKEIDPSGAGAALPAPLLKALRQHAATGKIYLGESPLRWDLCNRQHMVGGIQIELDGADPSAARLTLYASGYSYNNEYSGN